MNLKKLIEFLAFGRNAPKPGPCLGMYLSPEAVYISQTHIDKAGKIVVEQLLRIPVPVSEEKTAGPSASTLNTSFLTDNAQLETLIRDSMARVSWDTKRVMVTLSQDMGLLRYFTMPSIDRRFWKSAIPLEAKKHIPIPFDVLDYDYHCVSLPPDSEGHSHLGTLIAVTQKHNLPNITGMLDGLDLTLAGIELAPCSLLKIDQALGLNGETAPAQVCQVHFGEGVARILIADKGLPVFFREVVLNEESGVADQRKVDIGGCISFAQKSLQVGNITAVTVSGTSAQLTAWKEVFAQETGLPVQVRETASLLGIRNAQWGGLCAIGASLRFLLPGEAGLDLGAVNRISEDDRAVARDILFASGILTAFLLILGLFKMGLYQFKAQAFKNIPHNAEFDAVLSGKTQSMVEEMLGKMRTQAALTQAVCGKEGASLVGIIKDIVESLPEKAWLTNLSIQRPLQKTAASAASLALSGHATAQDIEQEQELVYQFQAQLAKSPVLGHIFTDIKTTISHEQAFLQGNPVSDPDLFSEQQERRTRFKMESSAQVR